jgi:hypothetical protein
MTAPSGLGGQTVQGEEGHAPAWLLRLLARDIVLVAVTAALILFCCSFGAERWGEADGMGADGGTYAAYAQDFYRLVFLNKVPPYYIQRVFPSAVIYYTLCALHIPKTIPVLIGSFLTLDILLVVLIAWGWCGVARELRLSLTGKWLGWCALVVNYACLKWIPFYPVLTDTAALALGLFMVLAYLRRSTLGLMALTFIGAFTWPTCLVIGALLIVFPRQSQESEPTAVSPLVQYGLAGLVAAVVGLFVYRVLRVPISVERCYLPGDFSPTFATQNLSIVLVTAFVFVAMACLLRRSGDGFRLDFLVQPRWWGGFLIAGSLVVLIWYLQYALANHQPQIAGPQPPTLLVVLRQTAYTSCMYPGFFLVTHVAYFGAGVLLLLLFWPGACDEMNRMGRALPLIAALTVLLALNPQTRCLSNLFPMLLPFAIKAADRFRWERRQVLALGAAAWLLSKMWIRLNYIPIVGAPDFQAVGPWFTFGMYLMHGIPELCLAVAFFVAWSLLPARPATEAEGDSRPEEPQQLLAA